MTLDQNIRVGRFGWTDSQVKGIIVEGEPDYEEISLTERVEGLNRGETPQ